MKKIGVERKPQEGGWGRWGGLLRSLPNLIGPGGDSKRLRVSWRQAVLAAGEL